MPGQNDQPDPTEQRTLRVILWRRIQGVGGLLLAACFFLPAVDACSSPVVPAKWVWNEVGRWPPDLEDLPPVFLLFIAAYLFGLLSFIIALRGYSLRRQADRVRGVSIAVLLAVVIALVLAGIVWEVVDVLFGGGGFGWELGSAFLIGLTLLSAAYWLRSVRMGPAGLLSLRWYGALLCVLWFGGIFVDDPGDTHYGLWLSLGGAVVIAVGAMGEAKARTGRSIRRTLVAMFTCRLKLFDIHGPRCRKCEYLLIGLTTPRCPECGQPFAWEDCAPEPLAPAGQT